MVSDSGKRWSTSLLKMRGRELDQEDGQELFWVEVLDQGHRPTSRCMEMHELSAFKKPETFIQRGHVKK